MQKRFQKPEARQEVRFLTVTTALLAFPYGFIFISPASRKHEKVQTARCLDTPRTVYLLQARLPLTPRTHTLVPCTRCTSPTPARFRSYVALRVYGPTRRLTFDLEPSVQIAHHPAFCAYPLHWNMCLITAFNQAGHLSSVIFYSCMSFSGAWVLKIDVGELHT